MRALLVFVAALLVPVAAVGAAGGLGGSPPADPADRAVADDPVVAQADGTVTLQQINVLDVPASGVERSSVGGHYVDLGPSVGLSTNATTDRLRTLEMVERVEAAETATERRERLRTAFRAFEADVDDLDRRQTAEIRAYNRNDLSSRELLVSLVRFSTVAEEYNTRRARLESLAAETPGFELDRGRLASIGNRLSAFTGPVRTHAGAVLRGEADPTRFYLATGTESVTVTTVVDGDYLRESYRGDLRNGEGNAMELEVALDIVSASYPIIWNTTREQTQVFGGGETYPVRIAHSRGDLTAFVDSNARVVYAEHQRRSLDTVVADDRFERSNGGIRLSVNHTYPGGPVRIQAIDESTGDPLDADVSMAVGSGESAPVGTTGEDGVLWTLSPNRQYTVAVEALGESAEVVIAPGTLPRVERVTADGNDGGGGSGNATATPTPTG
ncbi:DUF7096 domain-containing protein [Haloplanus salilacus]|uniref:DUF7096 domain-containing protein n=1 Tax=Haloplanus salilacus TaxID=2949994 RepID=UPI0030D17FF0